MTAAAQEQAVRIDGPSGTHELLVPTDMFNVMAPPDPEEAREVFAQLFADLFPSIEADDRVTLAAGLVQWREQLMRRGIIFHGMVAAPAGLEHEGHVYGDVYWNVFAGIADVPAYQELDAGVVAARLLGDSFDTDGTHTESFDTAMGWGAGFITELPMASLIGQQSGDQRADVRFSSLPSAVALAGAVSAEHGQTSGLFVVGFAFDVEQKHEMASIVALMAGKSRITVDEPGNAQPNEAPT